MLLPFLTKHFPEIKFIASTHSVDFIASAVDCNILILREGGYEVLDSNDYQDIEDVMAVFKEVFHETEYKNERKQLDSRLRMLLNNRIAGMWGPKEEEVLKTIDVGRLTNVQKLIYKQIKEW